MPMQKETIQFRIPADPRHVAMIRKAMESIARSLCFPEDVVRDIGVSVSEALANAIEHGSPQHEGNVVIVSCKVIDEMLKIDVRDQGAGFAPPTPEDQEIWEERGRGLKLIYRLMDNVRINHTEKGSQIRMVKRRGIPSKLAKSGGRKCVKDTAQST